MRCDGLRLVEDRKAQDTARLHALREAAHIGMVDTDAGCFRSFESPAALIRDLKDKKLLDKTLIVVATEFGRPPEFDGRGGRGHQGTAFSMVLAGGGLKHCGAYGTTDELAKKPVENPVPLVDFHATIHAAMGIDPAHELMDGTRPVPITDGGKPVAALFG